MDDIDLRFETSASLACTRMCPFGEHSTCDGKAYVLLSEMFCKCQLGQDDGQC